MKKLLIASSLLVSGSVMAQGFYMGGAAGLSADTAQVTTSVAAKVKAEVENLGKNSMAGGVYGGYAMDMDGITLALEVDYLLGNSEKQHKSTDSSASQAVVTEVQVKRKDSYSASLIGALPVTPDMALYGRVGYTRAKFEVEQNVGSTVHYDDSDKAGGLTLGFGASYKLDQNLSLRADYRYVNYGKVNIEAKSTAPTMNKFEADSSQQVFLVGVQYSF